MPPEPLAFGDIVRVMTSAETVDRGIGGGVGMVVGVKVAPTATSIIGGGSPDEAVLVSLEEPMEESVLIASRLLEPTGETSEWEIVDGIADARGGNGEMESASHVRVRSTPETEKLGLAGLLGEVMGETIPSSSGVDEVVGGNDADYAVNAWFEERREQFWFHPDLLEPVPSE
jgi:xanthosine utilization system XapX-like protein